MITFLQNGIPQSALLWVTLTLGAYLAAEWISRRLADHPLANPVLLASLLIGGLLMLGGIDYARYRADVTPLHVLLGPATVALAVPLAAAADRLRHMIMPLLIALISGGIAAVGATGALAHLFPLGPDLSCALLPRSVTTPIALGIAAQTGALPELATALVIATGIIGAVIGPAILARLGIHDPRVIGFALGIGAHGIGAARAVRIHAEAGAMAGLAMGLHGLIAAFILPLFAGLFC